MKEKLTKERENWVICPSVYLSIHSSIHPSIHLQREDIKGTKKYTGERKKRDDKKKERASGKEEWKKD